MTDTNWREDMPAVAKILSPSGCSWFALQVASPPVMMGTIAFNRTSKLLAKKNIVLRPFTKMVEVDEEGTP